MTSAGKVTRKRVEFFVASRTSSPRVCDRRASTTFFSQSTSADGPFRRSGRIIDGRQPVANPERHHPEVLRMPVAHRQEEGLNLLGRQGVRLLLRVSGAGAGVEPLHLDDGVLVQPELVDRLVHDAIAFDSKPAATQVSYDVALGVGTAGLRLVGGTLEVLDAGGAPRLRVAPPFIVGADGTSTAATLAVAGCAVDTDPSPPWERAVTAPGAASCRVDVTWPTSGITYPAILDPRWTTTGSMGTARQEHTALLLSTGKVLVAGGRSSNSGTTGLASAELYDKTSGTWAATGSMTGGRRLHSMTQLASGSNPTTSGKVLVAGGIDGSTSLNTAQLYNPTAGAWAAAANLNAARHLHSENLLPDGRVLVSGGMNGTTTLQTAALYDPASGTGSWVATTGPIPPPGWRFGTATLIQTTNQQLNNKVLLVGGNNGTSTIASVFLFDPAQNAFSTLASLSGPRQQHTAVVLPNTNGKILVTGGKNGSTVLATAQIFDLAFSNGSWSSAGTMTSARFGHSATALDGSASSDPDGVVSRYQWRATNAAILRPTDPVATAATASATLALPLGQNSVVLNVYDDKLATSQASATINVVDSTPPALTSPGHVIVYVGEDSSAIVDLGFPGVADACDPRPSARAVWLLDGENTVNQPIPDPKHAALPLGSHVVRWFVTDAGGNTATIDQSVDVNAGSGTDVPPTLQAPPTCPDPPLDGSSPVPLDVRVCVFGRMNLTTNTREGTAAWASCTNDQSVLNNLNALFADANAVWSDTVAFNVVGFKVIADPCPPGYSDSSCNSACGGTPPLLPDQYGDICNFDARHIAPPGYEDTQSVTWCQEAWGFQRAEARSTSASVGSSLS